MDFRTKKLLLSRKGRRLEENGVSFFKPMVLPVLRVQVKDSDGNVWGENIVTALSGTYTPVTLTVQRTVSGSGKYLYVMVYQTSGADLNLNAYCKVTVNRLK